MSLQEDVSMNAKNSQLHLTISKTVNYTIKYNTWISELHTKTIIYFANIPQPIKRGKKPQTTQNTAKPYKQIKKTVFIGFQPTETFFNFVNMKASTVPLVT